MIRSSLTVLAIALCPAAANAQETGAIVAGTSGPLLRDDVSGSRHSDDALLAGIRLGPLQVKPALALRTEADSNVLNRISSKRGDVFVVFSPQVRATGSSGRVDYALQSRAALFRYAQVKTQNRETFAFDGELTAGLSANTEVLAKAGFARGFELNGSPEAAENDGAPVRFDTVEGRVGLHARLARAALGAQVLLARRSYADTVDAEGAAIDQSFRNLRILAFSAGLAVPLTGKTTALGEARLTSERSIDPLPSSDRTARDLRLAAGLRSDLLPLISAELLGGFAQRRYSSPLFRDFSGPVWRGRIEWYATPLITMALSSERTIVNSGLRDAAGVLVDTSSVKIYYELRSSFDLLLTASHARENYRDTGIVTRSDTLGIEATYQLTTRQVCGAFIRLRDRSSPSPRVPRAGTGLAAGLWLRVNI